MSVFSLNGFNIIFFSFDRLLKQFGRFLQTFPRFIMNFILSNKTLNFTSSRRLFSFSTLLSQYSCLITIRLFAVSSILSLSRTRPTSIKRLSLGISIGLIIQKLSVFTYKFIESGFLLLKLLYLTL